MTHHHPAQVRVASGMNVALGSFLIASPWLMGYASFDGDLTRNSLIVGSLVLICAALRAAWRRASTALSGANIAFGFWTVISPRTFGYAADSQWAWVSLLVGVAVMVLAAWSTTVTIRSQHNQHA